MRANSRARARRAGGRRAAGRGLRLAAALLAATATSGCIFQRYVTNTARSSTEQLLLSEAIERAVARLDLPEVSGIRVAVEIVSLSEPEEEYLRAVVEARIRGAGGVIAPREEAERVLLLIVGALGTASRDTTFGIPPVPVGGFSTPGLPLYTVLRQRGYAKIRLVWHDAAGAWLGESPSVIERAVFNVWSLFFVAYRSNDIYPGEERAIGFD